MIGKSTRYTAGIPETGTEAYLRYLKYQKAKSKEHIDILGRKQNALSNSYLLKRVSYAGILSSGLLVPTIWVEKLNDLLPISIGASILAFVGACYPMVKAKHEIQKFDRAIQETSAELAAKK